VSNLVLIGEAPGPNTDPAFPLFPLPARSAGYYLCKLTGLSTAGYLRTFERHNLLQEHPGHNANGRGKDRWPVREARAAAGAMLPFLAGRRVILVGRRVAEAFGQPRELLDFFSWQEVHVKRWRPLDERPGPVSLTCIPHPSGRNHWYNEPGNRERATAFFQQLLTEAIPRSLLERGQETERPPLHH
jgi:hypothetical protein